MRSERTSSTIRGVARELEQREVELDVERDVGDEVTPRRRLLDLDGERPQLRQVGGRTPRSASARIVGTSMSARSSVTSSSSSGDGLVTRNPLLRTISTSPSLARSSIASRTGVAETPNCSARLGAE